MWPKVWKRLRTPDMDLRPVCDKVCTGGINAFGYFTKFVGYKIMSLTPRSRVLLENILLKEFTAIYEKKFVVVFTQSRQCTLSLAR
jgi:hypothetical protein